MQLLSVFNNYSPSFEVTGLHVRLVLTYRDTF